MNHTYFKKRGADRPCPSFRCSIKPHGTRWHHTYHLHRVPLEEIERGARHPRGRADWPNVGILAQRAKARPNLIGLARCQLLSVDGRTLRVRGLDAVDGSPVPDIKPYLAEFGPIGEVRQPVWSHEVMKDYYRE
ncbi:TrmO family methyltransferase [Massilia sp. CCM 9210]|nr:TrmO family methyltransferase [Massilia sp. CCM 9210]